MEMAPDLVERSEAIGQHLVGERLREARQRRGVSSPTRRSAGGISQQATGAVADQGGDDGSAPFSGVVSLSSICDGCSEREGRPVWHTGGAVFLHDRLVAPLPTRCRDCLLPAQPRQVDAAAQPTAPPTLLELAEAAGGNPWHFKATFADFRPWKDRERAYGVAREWSAAVLAKEDRYAEVRPLLLFGDTGVAKTDLAHCVLYELLTGGRSPGKGVLFVDWSSWLHQVRATYSAGEPTWPLIAALLDADTLILDDVFAGAGGATRHAFGVLGTIVNRREGRDTLVTTNEPPAELVTRYGHLGDDIHRVHSRLGAFRVVPVRSDVDGRFERTPAAAA
jgi:hypothetical protein